MFFEIRFPVAVTSMTRTLPFGLFSLSSTKLPVRPPLPLLYIHKDIVDISGGGVSSLPARPLLPLLYIHKDIVDISGGGAECHSSLYKVIFWMFRRRWGGSLPDMKKDILMILQSSEVRLQTQTQRRSVLSSLMIVSNSEELAEDLS